MKYPCFKCEKRSPACQDTCKEYKLEKAAITAQAEVIHKERAKEKLIRDYTCDHFRKARGK